MPLNQNPWASLKLKPLSPDEMARLGELLSAPIIEPPFHGEALKYWPVHEEEQ